MSWWHKGVARIAAVFVVTTLWWVAAPIASALPAPPAGVAASVADSATGAAHEVTTAPKEAYRAYERWEAAGWPRVRTWHVIDGERCYSGGRFGNYENRLPAGGDYFEYDVLCHPKKPANRGPKRVVVDFDHDPPLGYYTDDHYKNFQRM